MTAHFWVEETFPGTQEQITGACFTALSECRFTVTESNDAQGWIRARTRISFRSWGENITITVQMSGKTEIVSQCRVPTTIFDWGKNRANVNKLLSKLRAGLTA